MLHELEQATQFQNMRVDSRAALLADWEARLRVTQPTYSFFFFYCITSAPLLLRSGLRFEKRF
jgi:hypothetical protein